MRLVTMIVVIGVTLLVSVWAGNLLASMLGMTLMDPPLELRVVTVRHWLGGLIGAIAAGIVVSAMLRRWREQDAERAMFRRARTEHQIRSIKY
jgi:fructose-specific phosphotransferase system IIC component